MKKNNTHFEHSHMRKHLDDSLSNVGGDEDLNVDGDDSGIDGDDFSNARGGRGGFRRGGGAVVRHRNYVRRNFNRGYGWGGWGYPVGVYPATALYVDDTANTAPAPNITGDIKITKLGKAFLKKNPKGVNGVLLSYIKSGNRFDAEKLNKELQIKDFNKVIRFMNKSKFIEIIK